MEKTNHLTLLNVLLLKQATLRCKSVTFWSFVLFLRFLQERRRSLTIEGRTPLLHSLALYCRENALYVIRSVWCDQYHRILLSMYGTSDFGRRKNNCLKFIGACTVPLIGRISCSMYEQGGTRAIFIAFVNSVCAMIARRHAPGAVRQSDVLRSDDAHLSTMKRRCVPVHHVEATEGCRKRRLLAQK